MPTLRVRIVIVLLAMLTTAAVVGGIIALRQSDSETEQVVVPIDFSDFYLSGREEFSICVDAAGDAQSTPGQLDAIRGALDAAMERALQIAGDRLGIIPVQYSEPIFVEGCPEARLLSGSLASERPFDRRYRNDLRSDAGVGFPGGGQLNAHREFVYFVDPKTYADAFGAEPYAGASEQFASNGIWTAVTRALYLPTDADSRAIQDGLLLTLSLVTRSELEGTLDR